jgi:hypothetical protein
MLLGGWTDAELYLGLRALFRHYLRGMYAYEEHEGQLAAGAALTHVLRLHAPALAARSEQAARLPFMAGMGMMSTLAQSWLANGLARVAGQGEGAVECVMQVRRGVECVHCACVNIAPAA